MFFQIRKNEKSTISLVSIPITSLMLPLVALHRAPAARHPVLISVASTGAQLRLRAVGGPDPVFAISSRIFLAAARPRRRNRRGRSPNAARTLRCRCRYLLKKPSSVTTNLTVNRSEQCSRCNGAGDIGGPVMVCATCKGSGQVQRAGGRLRFAQECQDCGGTGRRRSPCSLCKGKGTVPKTETVKVRIPAGVETGSRVRIPGKGEGGRLGAPPGDLHIITNVGSHKYFTRKGD